MRPPSRTFKSEIAAFRKQLVTGDPQRDSHWKCQLALEILDRWERHASVESIWNTIRSELPSDPLIVSDAIGQFSGTPEAQLAFVAATAAQFIATVVAHRIALEEIEHNRRAMPDIERRVRAGLKRPELTRQALTAASLLVNAKDLQQRLLSRKKETAARQRFMAYWHNTFRALCGQPFDSVVADLTCIAFAIEVDENDVRAAAAADTRRQDHNIRDAK